MKVRATQSGFFGHYIEAGQVFDVPNGVKGSWFEPFKGKAKAENDAPQNPDGNDGAGSDGATGNGNDESLT